MLRCPELLAFSFAEHGFGTRNSGDWPGEYTRVSQIHSAVVVNARAARGTLGEGDALITNQGENWIGIRTADCVPLLIVDPVSRSIAAVHGGWRGTAKAIASETVRAMEAELGATPHNLHVAIGPCIRECCFEVGKDVAAQFEPWLPDAAQRERIDLVGVSRRQLVGAGVDPGQIYDSGFCSVCDASAFHSWRRDREQSGRMVAAIRRVEL